MVSVSSARHADASGGASTSAQVNEKSSCEPCDIHEFVRRRDRCVRADAAGVSGEAICGAVLSAAALSVAALSVAALAVDDFRDGAGAGQLPKGSRVLALDRAAGRTHSPAQ